MQVRTRFPLGLVAAAGLMMMQLAGCGPSAAGDDDDGPGSDGGLGVDANIDPSCGKPENLAGCVCATPGEQRPCWTGDPAARGLGTCTDGSQTCVAPQMSGETFGATWSTCSGGVQPAAEMCADNLDHDCNGAGGCSDLACASETRCMGVCHVGDTRPCYDGPGGTSGVGVCRSGLQTCNASRQWDPACVGQVTPGGAELFTCHDGADNDCNGRTDCSDFTCLLDPGCSPTICTAGAMQPCYDGPAGTSGVAACHGGMQTCAADGKSWGACMGPQLPGAEGGHCSDGADNDCNGRVDCADPVCGSETICCPASPGPPADGTIYAHSETDLYVVNPSGWTVTRVGAFGSGDSMTDIAVTPDGRLYGISFSALYSINKTTARATLIASVPGASNNGLTFLPDGNLLASDSTGERKRINPTTGAVTGIGNFGQSLSSAGDLVAIANGTMYGVSSTSAGGGGASGNNVLLRIDTGTGRAVVVGPIGFGSVWGLAYVGARVIGFTTAGQIIEINPQTGAGTLLATRSVVWWGAGMSPLVTAAVCP